MRGRCLPLMLLVALGFRVAASSTTSGSASVSTSISSSTSASTSTSASPSLSPSPSRTHSRQPSPSGPASSRSPSPGGATASATATASRSAPSSRPSPSTRPSPTPSPEASATARGASGSGSHSPSVSASASRSAPSSRPTTSASALLSPSASAPPSDPPSASATPSQCPSASASAAASRSHAGATPSPSPSPPASATPPQGSASAAASPSGSASPSPSPSPSASSSASSCGSASPAPSASHCASASLSLSACPSASSSPTATGSRAPTLSAQGSASHCASASVTATPSASSSPSATASASSAATPSATSSAPPCSCKANAHASSSAGGACPTPLLNVSWPMGWRDGAQLLPNASAAVAPARASALVASWPAIRSAINITLPFAPSAQELVTLTCTLAGAGAALLGLAVQAQPASPSNCTPVTGGACSIALNASSPLTSTLYLYARAAAADNGTGPAAATVLCSAASALRGGASDRPCASAAAAPVYPRLAQLTPAPLPVRHLPSVWALVGAVLAEEYGAQGSFTLAVKGGARLALGAPPATCAAAGGASARPTWSTVSVAGSANASACAGDLAAALRLAGARALPGANFSFTTGVASHLLLVAPPLADFPAGGVGAALGALGQAGLQCRGPGDAPCDGNSTACCRVNWATQEVVSLSTPPYGEGAQSLCGGAAWCQVPLSLFALPPSANASSGSPFFNSSAVGSASAGRSPLAQQLWAAASSATAPTALYPPTVYPPTPLTLARSASAWPLACAAQPPPQTPAALFACLNASGLSLDLAPPAPPSLPDATGTEACTGLCLSSQCSVDTYDSLQSCKDVTPPSAAAPFFQQLASRCAYGFGTTCQPCVNASAAVCPGRNGLLVQPGHWAPPPDASGAFDLASVRECPPPALARCPGSDAAAPGRAPRCAPGYTGTACAVCQRGWFTVEDGSCASCPRLETYLELVENLAQSLGVLLGLAAALFLAAACALRTCGRAVHRTTSLPTLLLFLVLRVLALLLWVVIFSQQASLLFASVQSLAVYALRSVFELLAVLQFKGLSAPNSQCFGIPFPFTWACTLVVGLCYATVAGALGARWCCGGGSASGSGSGMPKGSTRGRTSVLSSLAAPASAAAAAAATSAAPPPPPPSCPARAHLALRDAFAALPRGAVLLLTLGYGTLTNVFASVVTCSAAAPMPYSRYLDLGGDGSSLPPTAFAQFGGVRPNFTLPSNFTVSVSLLADNPFQLCWEGYHTPAAAAGLACLVLFSLAFPLGALRVLQARGQGCYASFCVAAPASRAAQRTGCCHECYFCRRHSKWGSSRRFAQAPAQPPALPAPAAAAAAASAPAADSAAPLVALLRELLHMPSLREGFLPLHQLTMSSVTLLLALPKAMPAAALGADIALLLLTAAAAATIKLHLKPFQVSGEKWQTTTIFSFYAVTAFTALMLAVTRNTPRLSAAGSWVLSLLAILSGAAAVCLVLYKWAVALYRCHPEEEVVAVVGGKLGDAAAAAAAAEAEARAAAAVAARAAVVGAAAAAVAANRYISNPMHRDREVGGGGGSGGGGGGAEAAAAQPPPPSHSTAAWVPGVLGSGEPAPAQPPPPQQQQNPAQGGVGLGWEWGGGAPALPPPLPPRPVYREPLLHLPGAPGEGAVSAYVQYTVRAIAGETARAAILRRQRERRAAAAAAGAAQREDGQRGQW